MEVSIRDFYSQYGERLKLTQENEGKLEKKILVPEAERPGLSLTGYTKNLAEGRILIFGRAELEFLKELTFDVRQERLLAVLGTDVPAVIISRGFSPLPDLSAICEKRQIPIFSTPISTMQLFTQITVILAEEFSSSISLHGTLVEAFGVGVFITGDSAVGKSEAALGLVERGHRLISDDVVRVKKREEAYLEGSGPELTRH
ncbi:MAG: HPr kinase/phosphorylase, partial [Chlamydiia bacterium]|nr:HPr kinase/phosphorylase [Chlamydiia bacterium]